MHNIFQTYLHQQRISKTKSTLQVLSESVIQEAAHGIFHDLLVLLTPSELLPPKLSTVDTFRKEDYQTGHTQ